MIITIVSSIGLDMIEFSWYTYVYYNIISTVRIIDVNKSISVFVFIIYKVFKKDGHRA